MIRQFLVYAYVTFFCFYSFKDWYKSLCALILMAGVIQHPDMPRTLFGIQGLSPWNMLLFFVILGFCIRKSAEAILWDMPSKVTIIFVVYLLVIFVSTIRMMSDLSGVIDWAIINNNELPTFKRLISEYFINTIKWMIPGILIFYGCKSDKRFLITITSIIGLYFIYAIQIIRWVPLSAIAGGESLGKLAGKLLQNEIGINRDTLSMMMAGAFWASFIFKDFIKKSLLRFLAIFVSFALFLAQALTGGRAGYVSWIACGFIIGTVKYKKYLLLIPLILFIGLNFIPGVKQRVFTGVHQEYVSEVSEFEKQYIYNGINFYEVTSGRIVAWPYVIEKIKENPIWGYGREAMKRTGIASYLWLNFRESFPHPHNMYLQFLLDNGIIGFVPVIIFYFIVLKWSYSLFRKKNYPYCVIAGSISFSLTLAYLIGGLGSQYFYPVEESLGRWCAIFLMFRVYKEYEKKNFSFISQEPFI